MLRPAWCGRFIALICSVVLVTACAPADEIGPNASLALLVGDWDAARFTVTSKANPTVNAELVRDLGASFSLNVQPSGQYTAILTYQGTPLTEIGILETDGPEVVFNVSFPAVDRTRSRFAVTASTLVLDGDTEFDFTLDGKGDPATAHIELRRR
jgi:hypothetical protein